MKLIIATTVLALSAGTAFAQEAEVETLDFVKPQISLVDAAGIANTGAKGDLVAVELEYATATDPVYIAQLEGDSSFARIMIDGNNGEVLVSEVIEAKDEDALDAYMEQFSTEAEMAEMMELALMIDGYDFDLEHMDLSDEELDELEEMLEQETDNTETND